MDIKTISVAFVAIMVGAVAFGAMLPIFQDVTATEDTFTNEGYYRMVKLDSESNYKLFWDHTKPYEVTINDTDVISLSNIPSYTAVSIVASDLFSFRFLNEPSNPRCQMYGGIIWGFGGASVSSETDFTITVSGGSMTATNTADTPYNTTSDLPTNTYAINKDGPHIMKKSDVDSYVLEDSSIIAICGLTESGGLQAGVFGTGTVKDGLEYNLFRPSAQSDTATFSNETISYTNVSDHVNLVKLSRINFTVSLTGGDLTPTYTYFIVPYEVTAERTIQGGDGFNTIVNLIPLVIGMGLLLIAVWWFVVRKF